jgi:hypothetical protein
LVELALSGRDQESIVIDAWTTGAERQQDVIDGLLGLFKRFRSSAGFVEARLLKGSGGTTVLSYLRMRSAAHQQRVDGQPEIQAGLERLREIARPHRDLFDLVWVFTPRPTKSRFPLAWGVLVRSAGEESSVGALWGRPGESLVRRDQPFRPMTDRWPATYGHSTITSQPNTNSTNESRTTALLTSAGTRVLFLPTYCTLAATGSELDIGNRTEKTHVENSFKKHRATTRAEAAQLADSVGLLLPAGTDGQPPSATSI